MKFFQGISYYFIVVLTFLSLSLIESVIVNFFIEMFTFSYYIKLIVAIIFLIIINPILTYIITKKIPFKVHGLKEEDIYNEHPD